MKKTLLLILAFATVLLLMTSCDLIQSLIPGNEPDVNEEENTDNTDNNETPENTDNSDNAIDLSTVKFPDRTYTYDGNVKGMSVVGKLPDGVSVEYEGTDRVDAGTYTVTARFFKDGVYIEGADLSATLTINTASYNMSGVRLEDKSYEYTGEAFIPQLRGTLPEGVSVELKYSEIKNAGSYTVTAVFSVDSNHTPIEPMLATYTVLPANYNMSGISFEDIFVEYDGEAHSVFISGTLPETLGVQYVNNGKTEIGEYVVEAVFISYDPNYRAPDKISAVIHITPETIHPVELIYILKDDGTYEVVGWSGDEHHVVIPATYKSKRVTSIKSGAFEGNTNITYVSVPITVTNIGNKAFKGCTALVDFANRGALEVIGYQALANTAITTLTLPDTLVSIGQGALMNTPLESLTLPFIGGSRNSSNDYLGFLFGASSYSGNAATAPATLKSVTLSDTAEKIPAFAFFGISSLVEVNVGKGVTFIGNSAFYGTSVTAIYLYATVTDIPANASASSSPFYGLPEDTVIMLQSTAGAGFGGYWNAVGEGKTAITVYMKTYDYYLENKDSIKEADRSSAALSGITLDRDLLIGFNSSVYEYTAEADINLGYPNVAVAPLSPVAQYTVEQASSKNGGIATITVVSADMSATLVYKVKFDVVGTFETNADVVGKNGTTGTVTFVLDDGDHASAEFTLKMMEKYENLSFTYALLTNKLATLTTVYDPSIGKYVYVMDEDGKYTYTVQQTEVEFWNHILDNYNTEVISHTYSHYFWGNNDDGGQQKYVDSNGNVKTSPSLPVGSASADVFASLQIIEDLLGIRAITHTEPGIGVKTTDTVVNGVTYETYYTYYKMLIEQGMAEGVIVNNIGGVMGATSSAVNRYVTKDNIKQQNGIARMMVAPTDDTSIWKQFINNAAANDGWATFCIHKISPAATSGHYILESAAEELFAHAASQNVWIANYTEAALYYEEWASAEVSSTYEDGKVKVTITDSEDNTVYDEALTVKVYVPAMWSEAYMNGEALAVNTDAFGSFVYANIVPDSGVQEITCA